jgi:flagellar hook assembly protein FlgD
MKKLLLAGLAIAVFVAIVVWKDPLHLRAPSASAATLATNFTVVNSGISAWSINGNLNPTLTLNIASTYNFNVNAIGHPFFIKTAQITGSGSQWTEGTTNQGVQSGTLTFVVPADAPATLFYQCGVHSAMTGTINIIGPVGVNGATPTVAWLGRATPNPAHDGTSFSFGLPRDGRIEVSLFDVRGRRVRSLWSGSTTAGVHSMRWDGRDDARGSVSNGVYYYRLRYEGKDLAGQVLVMR